MTEPLTPEEARAEADKIDNGFSLDALVPPRDAVSATLRAYADLAERLKEIEEAVGSVIAAQDAWNAEQTEGAFNRLGNALDRLRSLMEKK